MVILNVTSLSPGAGKTAVCAGLGKLLAKNGKKVGYFKPVVGNAPDTDAAFMKDVLSLTEAANVISPSFNDETALKSGVKVAFDKIAAGRDIVLVESSLAAVRQALAGKMLAVTTYSEIDNLPMVTGLSGSFAVINKVPVNQMKTVNTKVERLKKQNVNILGVLPEDKALMTFSLSELAQLIDGQIISDAEMKDTVPANFMLGALTVDSALPYFSQKAEKVAILRAERADMQMAALATDTRALVLYGNASVTPMVQLRAKDKKAPIITTKLNVQDISRRMEETILKTKFNQPGKMPRLLELMSRNIDLPALYKALGLN